jgi:hypothetical protein
MNIYYKIIPEDGTEIKEIFKHKEELIEFCNDYHIIDYKIEECPVYYHYVVKYNEIDSYTFEYDKVSVISTLSTSRDEIGRSNRIYNNLSIAFYSEKELKDDEISERVKNIIKNTDYYIINDNIDTIYLAYEN